MHISALERAGLSTLNEGATVDYEIISDRGKELAGNLKASANKFSLRSPASARIFWCTSKCPIRMSS